MQLRAKKICVKLTSAGTNLLVVGRLQENMVRKLLSKPSFNCSHVYYVADLETGFVLVLRILHSLFDVPMCSGRRTYFASPRAPLMLLERSLPLLDCFEASDVMDTRKFGRRTG